MTYDTPVYFSIEEVYRYIENMNREVIGRLDGENKPKLSSGTLVDDRKAYYFDNLCTFVPTRLIALSQVTLDSGWPCRHNPTPWPRSGPRSSNFNGAFRMKRVALGSCSSAAGRMALVAPNAAGRGPAC